MHVKLRNRLEELKRGPRSRLPMFVGKKPVYYVDGRGSILCPTCANDVCRDWTDDDSSLDIPIEFHVAWFTEHRCSVCDSEIKGVYDD